MLSVTPLEGTTQLYRSIRENRPSPTPMTTQRKSASAEVSDALNQRSAGITAVRQPNEYPPVGRSLERGTLLRTYDAIGDDGHIVVLEGEAGIGKTRLPEEFLSLARGRGAVTFDLRCYHGESSLAYAPFIEMPRSMFGKNGRDREWLSEVRARLSEAARLLPEVPIHVARRAAQHVGARAAQAPLFGRRPRTLLIWPQVVRACFCQHRSVDRRTGGLKRRLFLPRSTILQLELALRGDETMRTRTRRQWAYC